jgi:uncharacterized protein DUF6415
LIERSATPAGLESRSVDIKTMRATAAESLAVEGPLPRFDELASWADQLRKHLRELIPAVECAARALPDEDAEKAEALAAVTHAHVRLVASPGPGLRSATQHARSLARELRALCDHYESLSAP